MTYLQALILGIIQGITEFLPVSSSGHLVIVPYLLGWNLPEDQIFPFDVLVQFSTLFAVLIYYRSDIIQITQAMLESLKLRKPFETVPSRVGWLTLLATIPAGIAGLLLKDVISETFSNPQLAAGFLLITALLLTISEKTGKKNRKLDQLGWKDASLMGTVQALAVFPGISRSGSTISGGLLRNLDRKTAGQFTFLMAIPIMGAAGIVSLFDLIRTPNLDGFFGVMAVGFITSGVVGFFAIKWLLGYINSHSLIPFALYCTLIGAGTLLLSFLPQSIPTAVSSDSVEAPVVVTYQSSTSWLLADMRACSGQLGGQPVLLKKSEVTAIPANSNLHISYGGLSQPAQFVYQLGTDEIVFAASVDNPIKSITINALRGVYSGDIDTYDNLAANCKKCAISENTLQNIKTWTYATASPMQTAVREAIQRPFSSATFIASTPMQVTQALITDPASIGFLPGNMVSDSMKIISLVNTEVLQLSLPILVSSTIEPDQNIQGWLTCLQQAIN